MAKFKIIGVENDKIFFSDILTSYLVRSYDGHKHYFFKNYKRGHKGKIRCISSDIDRFGDTNYNIALLYEGSPLESCFGPFNKAKFNIFKID